MVLGHTIANPGDDSTRHHLTQAIGGGLQKGTNGHDSRTHQNGVSASKPLSKPVGKEGTETATHIINGGHSPQECCISRSFEIMQSKEVMRDDDSTENSLGNCVSPTYLRACEV